MRQAEIKFGLLGASGKMGRSVIAFADRSNLIVAGHSRNMGAGKKEFVYQTSDVIIDFSSCGAAKENISLAEKYNRPILIATTGHEDLTGSDQIPVLYAPNTCMEWVVLKRAIKQLVQGNPNLEITIDDIHAATKKDAPSGTAKELLRTIAREDVKVTSVRKVDLASWHRISLFEAKQIINLEHQVLDREVYAIGAISLAIRLLGVKPGFYTVEDLI